ncbi:MAG: hypothetical protein JW910_07400, partial [Anaerolineae bacterium]|nr:hypothetical protein [Anaerolineae bacterium]
MNIPLFFLVSLMLNTLALTTMVGVFVLALTWRREAGVIGLAVGVVLAADITLIGINIVLLFAESAPVPDYTVFEFLVPLGVDVLALVIIVSFIAMTVFANVLGEGLGVMMRAALVLWVLLQLPLWRGDVLTLIYDT